LHEVGTYRHFRRLVVCYRRFETIYRFHLQISTSGLIDPWRWDR